MKKKKLPNGTYARTPAGTIDRPKESPSLTVKDAMLRRDVELGLAMKALRASVGEVISAAASLMHAASPGLTPRARDQLQEAELSIFDTGTLAKDIRGVAHQLDLLESVLARTARHVWRQET